MWNKSLSKFDHADSLYNIRKMTNGEVQSFVKKCVGDQIVKLFDHIEKIGGENPYPPTEDLQGFRSYLTTNETSQGSKKANYLEDKFFYHLQREFKEGKLLEHPAGFHLQIRKSRIDHPAAGHGVFVKGEAPPGTVVAIYPGAIYFPQTLKSSVLKVTNLVIPSFEKSKNGHKIVDQLLSLFL